MTETVSQAVEKRDNSPRSLIEHYSTDFAAVLPSHIRADTWVRLAQGALKKGKRITDKNDPNFGRYELEVAAGNNSGIFLATLLDAARLGLEPGTEQYYLTARKVKGVSQILGIIGYQGHIELMYRAGAVSSIIAEVVYRNDRFSYRPGRDDIPEHDIDWDSADRGALRLVYAFARMRDGATSKVIVLAKADIDRIKLSSQGANYDSSPWKTHEAAMWLKSAVRQLQKWVPTSAEHRNQISRSTAEAQRVSDENSIPPAPTEYAVIDGDLVDAFDENDWPEMAVPGNEAS